VSDGANSSTEAAPFTQLHQDNATSLWKGQKPSSSLQPASASACPVVDTALLNSQWLIINILLPTGGPWPHSIVNKKQPQGVSAE
jgi:hypothetical protein